MRVTVLEAVTDRDPDTTEVRDGEGAAVRDGLGDVVIAAVERSTSQMNGNADPVQVMSFSMPLLKIQQSSA